jgi:hypothetical protein
MKEPEYRERPKAKEEFKPNDGSTVGVLTEGASARIIPPFGFRKTERRRCSGVRPSPANRTETGSWAFVISLRC